MAPPFKIGAAPGQNIDHDFKTGASDMHMWIIPNFRTPDIGVRRGELL